MLIGLAALTAPVHHPPASVYDLPLPAPGSELPAVYRAHFLRAAPGHLTELIELYRRRIEVLTAAGEAPPVFMRHSQGDQWDLMVLSPIGSLEEYFSEAQAEQLDRAGFEARVRAITAWQEELFVAGPPADTLAARNAEAGFYHVEVFRALPGKYDELVRQREMENLYYHATERDGNLIFTRLVLLHHRVLSRHRALRRDARPAARDLRAGSSGCGVRIPRVHRDVSAQPDRRAP